VQRVLGDHARSGIIKKADGSWRVPCQKGKTYARGGCRCFNSGDLALLFSQSDLDLELWPVPTVGMPPHYGSPEARHYHVRSALQFTNLSVGLVD